MARIGANLDASGRWGASQNVAPCVPAPAKVAGSLDDASMDGTTVDSRQSEQVTLPKPIPTPPAPEAQSFAVSERERLYKAKGDQLRGRLLYSVAPQSVAPQSVAPHSPPKHHQVQSHHATYSFSLSSLFSAAWLLLCQLLNNFRENFTGINGATYDESARDVAQPRTANKEHAVKVKPSFIEERAGRVVRQTEVHKEIKSILKPSKQASGNANGTTVPQPKQVHGGFGIWAKEGDKVKAEVFCIEKSTRRSLEEELRKQEKVLQDVQPQVSLLKDLGVCDLPAEAEVNEKQYALLRRLGVFNLAVDMLASPAAKKLDDLNHELQEMHEQSQQLEKNLRKASQIVKELKEARQGKGTAEQGSQLSSELSSATTLFSLKDQLSSVLIHPLSPGSHAAPRPAVAA